MKIKAWVYFERPESFRGTIEVPDDFNEWEWDLQTEWVEEYMLHCRNEIAIDEFDYEVVKDANLG